MSALVAATLPKSVRIGGVNVDVDGDPRFDIPLVTVDVSPTASEADLLNNTGPNGTVSSDGITSSYAAMGAIDDSSRTKRQSIRMRTAASMTPQQAWSAEAVRTPPQDK